MKRFLFTTILITICATTFAQTSVRGHVVDHAGKAVDHFSIAILNAADSTYLVGGSFMDGKLDISSPQNIFLVRISSFDYADLTLTVAARDTVTDLGTITLTQRQITANQVTVSAKAPVVRTLPGGGLDFNVAGTMLSNAGTGVDVLRRTPFLMVDNNDNVSMIGRNSTIILINGRRILDQQELRSLSSADIKSVEVIDNPSAKYEADGHSVVNIITTKKLSEFFSGSVYARATMGRTLSYSINPELAFKFNKVSFYAGYTFSRNNNTGINKNLFERMTSRGNFRTDTYDLYNQTASSTHSYRAGFEYRPTESSTLGVQYTGYLTGANSDLQRNADISRTTQPQYTQYYYNTGTRTPINNVIGLYYSYAKSGYEINFVTDYTARRNGYYDNIEQSSNIYPEKYLYRNNSESGFQLFSAKLDGVIPVKEIKGRVEIGAKFSYVDNNGNVDFLAKNGEDWAPNPALSTKTRFKESITAAYATVSGAAGKFNYSAGLRVELNSVQNHNEGEKENETSYSRIGFFPNMSIGYANGDKISSTFSYSRRVYRPSYNDLNSSISYLDSLSVRVGNPNLQPVYYNTMSVNSKFLGKFIVNLSASYIEQPIDMRFLTYGPTGESQLTIMENSPNRWMLSATVGALLKHKIWSTQIYGGFVYAPASIVDDDVKYTFYNSNYYLAWYNQISLPHGWGIEANASVMQPAGSYMKLGLQVSADVSVTKKFLKDRLILQLSSYNQFLKWTQYYQYGAKTFDMAYDDGNRYRAVLTLRYNFASKLPQIRSKNAGSEERDRM